MAVPKRKKSRARSRHRKARWMRTQPPTLTTCSRCKAATRPHTVCSECGYYAGREVLRVED